MPSPLSPLNYPRLRRVDEAHRDCLHARLLVSLWVLPGLVQHSYLAASCGLRAGLPYYHYAAARTDNAFALVDVDQ